jgi:hypothetical protein
MQPSTSRPSNQHSTVRFCSPSSQTRASQKLHGPVRQYGVPQLEPALRKSTVAVASFPEAVSETTFTL